MITLSKKLSFSELRKRAGYSTQIQLAKALSDAGVPITSAAISGWETDKYKPQLTPGETRILLSLLSCSFNEFAAAFDKESDY